MIGQSSSFRLFGEGFLHEMLADNDQKMRKAIEQENADRIISVNEEKYIEEILRKFSLYTPQIDFDAISVSDKEREETFSSRFTGIFPTQSRKIQIIIFHLPYKGNIELLRYRPNQYTIWSKEVFTENQNLCFEVANREENTEQVKAEKKKVIEEMKAMLNNFTKDIEDYNGRLSGLTHSMFTIRKDKILKNKKMLDDLL